MDKTCYTETMIEGILEANGFTKKEAKTYVAVLELGEAPISRVAVKAGLKRTTVYNLLDDLKRKNIISVNTRKGIQYLSAVSPRLLVERFTHSAALAQNALPALIDLAYASPLKPRVRWYEGIDGIKEVLKEFSYSKAPTMGFTDYEEMPKELFDFIRKVVVINRRNTNNRVRLIAKKNKMNISVQKQDQLTYGEHKLIEFPGKGNPIELLLYDNSKAAFLSFTRNELFAFVVDSQAVHQTLRNLFEFFWSTTK